MFIDDSIKDNKFKIKKLSFKGMEVLYLNRLDAHNAFNEMTQLFGGEVEEKSVYVEGDLITYLKNNGYEITKLEEK